MLLVVSVLYQKFWEGEKMGAFLDLFLSFINNIISLLSSYVFEFWNIRVSIWGLISALLITGLIINIFWKGSKT